MRKTERKIYKGLSPGVIHRPIRSAEPEHPPETLPLTPGLRALIIENLQIFEPWIKDRLVEKYKHRAEEEICNRLIKAGYLRGNK